MYKHDLEDITMPILKMVKDGLNGISHIKVYEVKDEYVELTRSNYNNLFEAFKLILEYLSFKGNDSSEEN